MYEKVTMKCGEFEHETVLSQADKTVLGLIGERLSAEDLQTLQNVFLRGYRNRAKTIRCRDLAHTVGHAIRELEAHGAALSCMYSFTIKEGPLASSSSGGVSGIRMPGDDSCDYSMRAGLGVCKLERRAVDENGAGVVTEMIDCRDRTRLTTANCGDIVIKRRTMKLELPGLLKELHSRLVDQESGELTLSYEDFNPRGMRARK
ncbi:MAG: hypothetical protein ACYC61_09225 [Isosphaeraceae bacterium]